MCPEGIYFRSSPPPETNFTFLVLEFHFEGLSRNDGKVFLDIVERQKILGATDRESFPRRTDRVERVLILLEQVLVLRVLL